MEPIRSSSILLALLLAGCPGPAISPGQPHDELYREPAQRVRTW